MVMTIVHKVALANVERGWSKERILEEKLFDMDWITKQY